MELRGREDGNFLVEAAGAAKRFVEREGARGGGEDENSIGNAEAVDAGEELGDDLRVFLVVVGAFAAEKVDVFDPDDRQIAARGLREAARRGEEAVHLASTVAVVGALEGKKG